jgi:hypothetical protein
MGDVVELQIRELHGTKSCGVDKNFPSDRIPEIGDDLVWDQGEGEESFVVVEVRHLLTKGKTALLVLVEKPRRI